MAIIDPFHSYACRYTACSSDGGDINPDGPDDTNACTLVVQHDLVATSKDLEFDVKIAQIIAVSPYIRMLYYREPIKRKYYIPGTSDQVQILLKYMNTGVYDPRDISHRHPAKYEVVFSQVNFYLFCLEIGYRALSDVVRVAILASLDVMSWAPIPDLNVHVPLPPAEGIPEGMELQLVDQWVFGIECLYSKFREQNDPVKLALLRYCVHICPTYRSMGHELGEDIREYKKIIAVDIYESEAPKYRTSTTPFSAWYWEPLGTAILIIPLLIFMFKRR